MGRRKSGYMIVEQILIYQKTSPYLTTLKNIRATFHVKQIRGKVAVAQWGVVRLSTDEANAGKGELELHEVLFMPGMRVNIFSLQRIRCLVDQK